MKKKMKEFPTKVVGVRNGLISIIQTLLLFFNLKLLSMKKKSDFSRTL